MLTGRRIGSRRRSANSKMGSSRRLCMETLEPRLALTWAGVPPTSVTPPTNAVAVTLTSNDATGSATIATTEVDYYSFTATRTGSYAISATTPSSSVDTVLGVFSSTGQRLSYNDDISSSSNTDSRVTINLTVGTKYYVGITNYSSGSRGAYRWTIDGPAATTAPTDDAYENNDTLSTAYNLGTLSAARTVNPLVMADSADWFRFTTSAAGTSTSTVSISFLNSQGNLQLALYNSSGAQIRSSLGTGNSESVSLNGLTAGTYYVDVFGNAGATNPNYSLTVTPPTTTPPTTPVTAFPNVAYYGGSNDWNLNSINAPEAWAQGYTGQGVTVAIIDTGVNMAHPELASQIWVNTDEIVGNGVDDDHNGYIDDYRGWDFASNDNNPSDGNGHGTHVAGTVAAHNNGTGSTGVAPGATIMPVRVLGNDGSGTDTAVAAGIRYAALNGADIISMSLGGSYSSAIQSAIVYAQSLDVFVAVASGNESAPVPSYPARFGSTLNNVLSVGAYSSSNSLASFSNRVGTSGAVQIDAPGVSVYSTSYNGNYATFSGTSMATPHVAGLAALALSANRSLTANQLRTVIVNGADRVISGSDSRGGIDSALTVAMARAGVTSVSAFSASSSTQTSSAGQTASARRLSLLPTTSGNGTPGSVDNGTSFAVTSSGRPNHVVRLSAASGELTAPAIDRALIALSDSEAGGFVAKWSDSSEEWSSEHAFDTVFSSQNDWSLEASGLSMPAISLA